MSYSPNDRGPDLPPTRGRTRSAGLWIGLAALLLIGGAVWMQAGTSPSGPTTTSSSTEMAPVPAAPATPTVGDGSQAGNGDTQPSTTPSQP